MIRSSVTRMAFAAALLAPASLPAQGPEGPLWDSYRRAAEVVRLAAEAHGGVEAVRGLNAASFRWEGQDYAPTQGRIPSVSWDTAGNARAAMLDVRIDYARSRFVTDREARFGGGYLNASRLAGNGREFLSYNPAAERGMGGVTFSRDTTGTTARRFLASAGLNLPVLAIRAAMGRASTLRHLGTVERGGRREEAVAFSTAEGDPVTLYFDAETHLLTRREEMGAGSLGDEVDATIYSDYATMDGFRVPRALELRWNGVLTGRQRLAHFRASADLPDSLFAVPAGYTAAVPPAPLGSVRLSERVAYIERINGSYRSLVVDTDEGLLVVDAPLSAEFSEAAIREIEKVFPGRPFRWLVLTHHHGDHIGGVQAYVARGATVLAAAGSEPYLRRMTRITRGFGRIGGQAAAVAEPRIEGVTGRRSFPAGGSRVEVINVGPTSHAAAMLAVYVPSERLLFQGDLLRINEGSGPVMSPEATRDLDAIIRRFRLDVANIGAVHGMNGTMDDLRAALRKAETLR
ncbi:MAG TPA: MBL fold metallo-hydrolase [Longimicrobium sp.]|jgi:glyoxylase-like metal-dependent hydrolase (beta-lactamase superfamily II)|uniref:MBL fold metallo-hydrolase n=1 Tax=Longimicrobium sp. TaxID=2029185 RepID=UPI002ED8E88C